MNKLFSWLRIEPKDKELWMFFAQMVALALVNAFTYILIMYPGILHTMSPTGGKPFAVYLPLVPIRALAEEVLFRLPLVLFLRKDTNLKTLLIVSAVISVYFGYLHSGWSSIPLQGVVGFILCLVFLKCGGLQKKYVKAFCASSFVHIAYNYATIAVLLIVGQIHK